MSEEKVVNFMDNVPLGVMERLNNLVSELEEKHKNESKEEENTTQIKQENESEEKNINTFIDAYIEPTKYNEVEIEENKAIPAEEVTPEKENLLSIKIVKVKKDDYTKMRKMRVEKEPVTQVVLPQSGYSAVLKGLSSIEIESLVNMYSSTDIYRGRKLELSKIHDKIADTSIGRIKFDDFLQMTSLQELNTLWYGIFCSTYPSPSEFPFECEKCGTKHKMKIPHEKLLLLERGKEEEIANSIFKIIEGAKNPKELIEKSQVNTLKRIKLPKSNIIIELKTPTLYDYLEKTINNISSKMIEEDSITVNLMPYIHNIYVLII